MTLNTHEEANTPNQYGWRQVAPLQYSRPLGDMEKAFATLGAFGHAHDSECSAIDFPTTFTYESTTEPDVTKAVRRVWQLMRLEFLTIGATVDMKTKTMVYPAITSELDLEKFADETFHVVPWPFKTFDAVSLPKPSPVGFLYFCQKTPGSNVYEILPHTAHWRVDGFGGIQFVDKFLSALSAGARVTSIPSIQEQVDKLPATVEEMASIPETPSPEATALVAESTETMSNHMPSIGMRLTRPPTSRPGPVQNARVKLNKEETMKLMKGCKSKGVKFMGALNAAFVLALRKIAPENHKHRNYVSFIPISIRAMMPEPYGGADYCMSASVFPVPLTQPYGSGFHEMATNFQKACDVRNLPEFLSSVRLRASMFEKMVDFKPPEEWGPNTTAFLNPLGDIGVFVKPDRDLGVAKISVIDAFPSTHVMAKENPIYTYIFRGELHFIANYNEAYYSHHELIRLMETFLYTLEEQLRPERQARL